MVYSPKPLPPNILAGSVKFVFSKKATKIDEIFTVDLTFTRQCQIEVGKDFALEIIIVKSFKYEWRNRL